MLVALWADGPAGRVAGVGDECGPRGAQGGEAIRAAQVAEPAGTIPWDPCASLTARLPSVFPRAGVVERVTGG